MEDVKSIIIDENAEDISTFSNYKKIVQKKMDIYAYLDFSKKTFSGHITTTYSYIDKNEKYLILDLKGPQILKVAIMEDQTPKELSFKIDNENKFKNSLGTPLIIKLPEFEKKPEEIRIKIDFVTNENCGGIQFLEKEQTFNKNYNFMFTQCEAIQCRSLISLSRYSIIKSNSRSYFRSRKAI